MGKIKSTEHTTKRIISMVESGDYDVDTIQHMIDSLVENRDRRIRQLEKKARPKEFNMTLKTVSGALRETIRQHGPITPEWIGSAAKRIYGNCQQLVIENPPVERPDAPPIKIVYNQNTTHKLTVTRDGSIRIKVAKDTATEEAQRIVESFTAVAKKALKLNMGTLRGQIKKNDTHNKITLYTDSKKEHITFDFVT